jgi:hypothetical protein
MTKNFQSSNLVIKGDQKFSITQVGDHKLVIEIFWAMKNKLNCGINGQY